MSLLVRRGSNLFKKVDGFEKERETCAADEEQEEGHYDVIRFI